ncbi:hypothetical protein C4578_03400 [Candidatus Microgenomates bacterium]|jgi:S-DNA-T family DNA segregation ATPase FtsK/SpoIIIE|nr:MAG: hypothetical protein C4578_03400 [Candidatus Microgenomates bacterium]
MPDDINSKVKDLEKRVKALEKIVLKPEYLDSGKDELFDDALRAVRQFGRASTSLLQRRLSIGYNRAVRILDQLAQEGYIEDRNDSKPRKLLV